MNTTVKMPDILKFREQKIWAALARRNDADKNWKEATLELAIELAGARADHGKDNNKFGEWLDSRFGEKMVPKDERAILIRWGNDPDQIRALLEKTDSRSIQVIDRGYRSATKTPQPESRQRGRPPTTKNWVKEVVRAYKAEHGAYPSRDQLKEIAGPKIHHSMSDQAIGELKAEEETRLKEAGERERAVRDALDVEALKSVTFTKAQQKHVEIAIRRRAKELEAQFEERVRKAVGERFDVLSPGHKLRVKQAEEKYVHYQRLINNHKPIFTEAEFMTILACLHPDNSASPEKREHAFKTFNLMKLQLTGKA